MSVLLKNPVAQAVVDSGEMRHESNSTRQQLPHSGSTRSRRLRTLMKGTWTVLCAALSSPPPQVFYGPEQHRGPNAPINPIEFSKFIVPVPADQLAFGADCVICLGTLVDKPVCRIQCDHIFHEKCIKKWVSERTPTCPVCRANVNGKVDPTGN